MSNVEALSQLLHGDRRPITGRSRPSPRRTTGGTGTPPTWTLARPGNTPEEASAAAGRYMAEVKHIVVSPA